ncbi:5-(carboxyamino)imidazole ribonucleotide synthase [Cytophagaceae bacterium ABcell3]|nr:5-(carboxyamino)imidazole ribonucleotide synthase [Cytophagaceae bacterium ABcell3]
MEFYKQTKLGILGGGQLGRMLIQSCIDFNVHTSVLDPDKDAPCAGLANEFMQGSLTDYETVLNFGRGKDVLTIEIENVNADALKTLRDEGVQVFPEPEAIKVIQDKRVQKQFYRDNGIPTSDFVLVDTKEALSEHASFFPAFQKLGKAGYDGRGVYRIKDEGDLQNALDGPSVLEKLVDFDKEISVLVARNTKGDVVTYPVVEMVFHPVHNLVEYLFSPADVSAEIESKARETAVKVIESLNMTGLLAVEMFIKDGQVLVNEVAPRPHNSGHQTIKANYTSQYEQHLRAILGLSLGSTKVTKPSALVNLLGADGYKGDAKYQGVDEILSKEGVFLHLYGKKKTKPFRKMGHITILDDTLDNLKEKAEFVKKTIKVVA